MTKNSPKYLRSLLIIIFFGDLFLSVFFNLSVVVLFKSKNSTFIWIFTQYHILLHIQYIYHRDTYFPSKNDLFLSILQMNHVFHLVSCVQLNLTFAKSTAPKLNKEMNYLNIMLILPY